MFLSCNPSKEGGEVNIRRFIERGRKGYATSDLWSFDNWLSDLIARGLKEFKKDCNTYPSDGISWEDWMKILDEMIECFEEQSRSLENLTGETFEVYRQRMAYRKQKLSRGFELLERYYFDLWS